MAPGRSILEWGLLGLVSAASLLPAEEVWRAVYVEYVGQTSEDVRAALDGAAAHGCTAVVASVPWTEHERTEGVVDLSTLRTYLDDCKARGLRVILRIGPYLGTGWDHGGLPEWLLDREGSLRTDDPALREPVARWWKALAVATAEASLAGLEIEHEVGFDALPHGTAYLSALSQLAHELWPGVLTYSRWEPAGLTDPARAVALAPNDLPGLLRTTALAGPPPRILAEAMVSTWEEAEAVFSAAAAAGCRIAAVRLAPLPVPAPAARWDTAAVTSALEHLPENSWQPEPLARLALSPHQTCVYRWRLELPPGAEVALEFGPDTDSWIFVAPLVVPPSGGRSESERDGKGRKGTEGDGGDRNPQSEMGVGPGVRSLRSAIRNSQFAIRNRGRSLRAEDHDCYARLKDLPTACELLVVCAARPRQATWPLVRPGLRRVALQPGRRRPEFELRRWRVRRVDAGIGDEAPEVRPDFEDADWEEIEAGQTFQALFADYDGWAWYRTRLQIRAEDLAAGYTHLCFEGIDDDALIYVNGVRVGGKKGWDVPYSCDAAGALHPGENVLVLAIYDLARPGGIYQPAYLSWAPWGGRLLTEAEVARLDGESPKPETGGDKLLRNLCAVRLDGVQRSEESPG